MIGIIGGAGVLAAAELTLRLAQEVTRRGALWDHQQPQVVLFQATTAPSRSLALLGRGADFVPAYRDAVSRLTRFGATAIGMCCNTAHARLEAIRQDACVPVIDLIEQACLVALSPPTAPKSIAVLCSEGTRTARLYETKFDDHKSLDSMLELPAAIHHEVDQIIAGVKNQGLANPDVVQRLSGQLNAVLQQCEQLGARTLVLGCTELPLLRIEARPELNVVDTLDVLALSLLAQIGWPMEMAVPQTSLQ